MAIEIIFFFLQFRQLSCSILFYFFFFCFVNLVDERVKYSDRHLVAPFVQTLSSVEPATDQVERERIQGPCFVGLRDCLASLIRKRDNVFLYMYIYTRNTLILYVYIITEEYTSNLRFNFSKTIIFFIIFNHDLFNLKCQIYLHENTDSLNV